MIAALAGALSLVLAWWTQALVGSFAIPIEVPQHLGFTPDLTLILGTVGLASVIIHAVNQRRREFGVRVSVGATPRDLITDVLRSAGRLLVPGLLVGVVLAAGLARLAQVAIIGVNVLNPLSYLAVVVVQCAIVARACLAPALRASRVDPLVALRAE